MGPTVEPDIQYNFEVEHGHGSPPAHPSDGLLRLLVEVRNGLREFVGLLGNCSAMILLDIVSALLEFGGDSLIESYCVWYHFCN